jgi:hypothetical protein
MRTILVGWDSIPDTQFSKNISGEFLWIKPCDKIFQKLVIFSETFPIPYRSCDTVAVNVSSPDDTLLYLGLYKLTVGLTVLDSGS